MFNFINNALSHTLVEFKMDLSGVTDGSHNKPHTPCNVLFSFKYVEYPTRELVIINLENGLVFDIIRIL